ncbi:MAG: hypothetical protein DMG99_20730, partial [Acidobacteria bacterium]
MFPAEFFSGPESCIHIGFGFALKEWTFMRSLATLISFLTLGCFISLAQTGQQQKAQNKDADKKQALAAAAASKKDKARNEKKEEPKKEKEDDQKPGINAETFAGLKFRLIGP